MKKVILPSVDWDRKWATFKKEASLQDVAMLLEVSAAYDCGMSNCAYSLGGEWEFYELPTGETIVGCISSRSGNFYIEGVLSSNKKDLYFSKHPEFGKILSANGLGKICDLEKLKNLDLE